MPQMEMVIIADYHMLVCHISLWNTGNKQQNFHTSHFYSKVEVPNENMVKEVENKKSLV